MIGCYSVIYKFDWLILYTWKSYILSLGINFSVVRMKYIYYCIDTDYRYRFREEKEKLSKDSM